MRELHTIVVVRWKLRMTILLKCRMLFAMPATHNQTERLLSVSHFTIGSDVRCCIFRNVRS
jgi:hypothetical protein